ncbi:hypothetical protein [Dickeya poaceiphila]|uniref:Uncharacterized protein n=1 Tax=Dickeya poaceiphila TaxID=568768 RepID=A0A5B8IEI8_9GAMM|nr:hypothetical protein [Dickeya poaceiphila]QDX30937.1 hypothetical protein Dpoa569_0002886 [Dickeya poaceiphila]
MTEMTNHNLQTLVTEPSIVSETRTRFQKWLQTQFDQHYRSLRNESYRDFLKAEFPQELAQYDQACEQLRDAEFERFTELQTLGLFLFQQVELKRAELRRRRLRWLSTLAVTTVVTGALAAWHFGIIDVTYLTGKAHQFYANVQGLVSFATGLFHPQTPSAQ